MRHYFVRFKIGEDVAASSDPYTAKADAEYAKRQIEDAPATFDVELDSWTDREAEVSSG